MSTSKIRVIQDYEKLSDEIKKQIKLVYPEGYSQHLIEFTNAQGQTVKALPFETDVKIYLVRMSVQKAEEIILEDSDYNEDGNLKNNIREKYEDEYAGVDYLSENDNYDDDYDKDDDKDDDYDDDKDLD